MKLYAMHLDTSNREYTLEDLGEVADRGEAVTKWMELYSIRAFDWAAVLADAEPAMNGKLPYGSSRMDEALEYPLTKKAAEIRKAAVTADFEVRDAKRQAAKVLREKLAAELPLLVPANGGQPKPKFWELWKAHKATCIEVGFFVGKENGKWIARQGWHDGKKWKAPLFGTAEEQAERKKVVKANREIETGAEQLEAKAMDYRADRNDNLQFPRNQAMNARMEAQQEAAEK